MTLRLVDPTDAQAASEAGLVLDLWLWPLTDAPERRASLEGHLDATERRRLAGIADPDRACAYLAGRGRLREILAGYLGCAPHDVPLTQTRLGKPALSEGAQGQGPAFNLSHAGGWAALVAGPHGLALGIDIEPHRAITPGVAERVFTEAERAELAALPEATRAAGFFNGWTRKEALLKALGAGLSRPLDSFEVTLTPGAPARLTRLSGAQAERWQLLHFDLRPDFPGCIALRSDAAVALALREGTLPLPG